MTDPQPLNLPLPNDPPWLSHARSHIGRHEVVGPASNDWIRSLWMGLPGGPWFWRTYGSDDSKLPWCGAFVAHCLGAAKLKIPARYAGAMDWRTWGETTPSKLLGSIVVLERRDRSGAQVGGHVGFADGLSMQGALRILGGNQRDGVSIAEFPTERVIAWRWPSDYAGARNALPTRGTAAQTTDGREI